MPALPFPGAIAFVGVDVPARGLVPTGVAAATAPGALQVAHAPVAFDGARVDIGADPAGHVLAIDVVDAAGGATWRILADAATTSIDLSALPGAELAVERVRVTTYRLGADDACPSDYAGVVDLGGGDGAAVGPCAQAWSRITCVTDAPDAWACDPG